MTKKIKYTLFILVVFLIGSQNFAYAGHGKKHHSSWSFSFGVSNGSFMHRPSYWQPAPVCYTPCPRYVVHHYPTPIMVVPQQVHVCEPVVHHVVKQEIIRQEIYPTIQTIFERGELIKLNDDTLWGISPTGQYTTRRWHRGARILLETSGQYSFPYLLRNLETGEIAEANLKQTQ